MKVLEGYVDDGKAAPLEGVPAIVTVVGSGTIVASTATDADGHWQFDALPDGQEYFVNVTDIDGNAVVRGPWSGEVRDVWVRDRLSMSGTGVADLPNSGRTMVGGLPLVLDPDPANGLEWGATGLFSASGGLTQDLADTLYEPLDSAWTKSESDLRYSPIDAVVDAYTKAESDLRYEPIDTMYTKSESDARYPQKTDVDPYPNYLTQTEGDGRYPLKTDPDPYPTYLTAAEADTLFLTPAEGNAAYATVAHNHDTAYVQLTGGSVMTGLLGPSTHNTRDLGTTGTRWRALYGMTGDFTTSLTVATKPITPSPDAANIIEFRANGLYAAAGAVTDIWVNTLGDTMTGDLNMTANVLPTVTNTRDLGSTALRWRTLWATDADFTNAPTIGGAAMPYVSLHGSTMDGELWFSMGQPTVAMWEGDAPADNRSLKIYMPSNDGRLRVAAQRDDGVEGTRVLEVRRTGNNITTLRIGTVASDPAFPAAYTGQPGLLVQHEGATDINSLSLGRAASDTTAETMNVWRVRGTWASKAAIANGDFLFDINSWGWSGANWLRSAIIRTAVAGTVTTTAVPTSMTFYTADSAGTLQSRLGIDAAGLVKVNPLTDPAFPAGLTDHAGLLVQHEGASQHGGMSLARAASDATAERLFFWRARGTWASKVAVANLDAVGSIQGWGWSGANWLTAASIAVSVSGTVTTTAVPGSLTFNTADSAGSLGARLSISPAGLVGIGAKADGTATAQLDTQSTAAGTAGLIVRNHASAAATLPFLAAHNSAGSQVILGANNTGWVTDAIFAVAIGTYATKRIPVYNSSGTLQGYLPLYN